MKENFNWNHRIDEGPILCEGFRILHGANYFSSGPIVLFRINLNSFDEVFTNEIEGFLPALQSALPGLIEHHCSEGVRGGFFLRVADGTLLGHVMEHMSIEIQEMAGMKVSYGKTRSTKTQGVYHVIYRFKDPEAGILAGITAFNWINAFLSGREYSLLPFVQEMIRIREKNLLGPTTQSIADEARKRDIPYLRLDEFNLIQLGSGKFQKRIRSSLTQDTSAIGAESIRDRFFVMRILDSQKIKTIPFSLNDSDPQFVGNSQLITYRNRITGLPDQKLFFPEFIQKAQSLFFAEERPLLYFKADLKIPLFRFLVINFKLVAVCQVKFTYIVGDGYSKVCELIETENNESHRKEGDKSPMGKILIDDELLNQLSVMDLSLQSVIPKGQHVLLHATANPNYGSETISYSESVSEELKELLEKTCRILNIDVAGVDVFVTNPKIGFVAENEGVFEVFSSPNFRMHVMPFQGDSVNVAKPFVDYLFPEGKQNCAPLISISGNKHRKELLKLLTEFYMLHNKTTGVFEAEFEIQNDSSKSDRISVALLMQDPDNERLVVETTIGQINRDGLPYDFSNTAIILGIDDSELEKTEYHEFEDLVYAYSVVVEETLDSGFVILNYDDPALHEMEKHCKSAIIWLSEKNGESLKMKVMKQDSGYAILEAGDTIELVMHHRIQYIRKNELNFGREISVLQQMILLAFERIIEVQLQ